MRVTQTREELIRRNIELDELHAELDDIERHKARNSLAVYCGLMQPELIEREDDLDDLKGMHKLSLPARYVPAAHHRLLISKLEDLERGYVEVRGERVPFKRLMVFMPPGSAKSTYGSVLFPSWYLGKHPTHDLIQGSYNGDSPRRLARSSRYSASDESTRGSSAISFSTAARLARSCSLLRDAGSRGKAINSSSV